MKGQQARSEGGTTKSELVWLEAREERRSRENRKKIAERATDKQGRRERGVKKEQRGARTERLWWCRSTHKGGSEEGGREEREDGRVRKGKSDKAMWGDPLKSDRV